MTEETRHTDTDRATCPHCGHRHEGSWDWEDGQYDCSECGKPFELSSYIERVFSTEKSYFCATCGHRGGRKRDGSPTYHCTPRAFDKCPGTETREEP